VTVTDDHELDGLDPFDLLDQEAARLYAFFRSLPDDDSAWSLPTRCQGWNVRDVLGHLAAGEDYHRACLEGTVAALLKGFGERGATDLDSANALGVQDYADRAPGQLVEEWRAANAVSRGLFRERGDGSVDTSIGEYPCRWQAFHVASELATHADDIDVLVTGDERDGRRAWRAPFSRFALSETKSDLSIKVAGGKTVVGDGTINVELDDDELIEAVAGRVDDSSRLDFRARKMLSTMLS
jgi:uncharacterized protein (TIGR03083 family)